MKRTPQPFALRIIVVAVIAIGLFLGSTGTIRADEKHVSGEKALAIGGTSFALFWGGHMVKESNGGRHMVISGPILGEMSVHRFLAGEYHEGKTNWLDNDRGSIATPIISGTTLLALNLSYPREDKGKDAAQDLFLFSTGLAATKGLTDLAKGLFGRPRPYVRLSADFETSRFEGDSVYKHSSFFSGHASSAFFSVTYLNKRVRSIMKNEMSSQEYRDWRWAPPVLLYGWATYVAWTRLHAYRHYLSDVTMGALAGFLVAELFFSFNDDLDRPSETDSPQPTPMVFKISIPL